MDGMVFFTNHPSASVERQYEFILREQKQMLLHLTYWYIKSDSTTIQE